MDLHGVENLELPAIQTLTGFFVTHASILTPDTSRTLSPSLLRRTGRSATLVFKALYHKTLSRQAVASVDCYTSLHLSVRGCYTSELLRYPWQMTASKSITW